MKILILAYYFPPENNMAKMASLRPHSWKKYWDAAGHQVYVVTSQKSEDAYDAYDNKVFTVTSWPHRMEIKHSQDANTLQNNIKASIRFVLRTVHKYLRCGTFFQVSIFWILPAVKIALRLNKTVKFDLIVSTYGPPANHIVAKLFSSRSQVPWVADYRDLWHGNEVTRPPVGLLKLEDIIERRIVRHANFITTVSDGLREQLESRFNVPVIVSENGFDTDDISIVNEFKWPEEKVYIIYTGTLYPERTNPAPLFEALSTLKSTKKLHSKNQLEVIFCGCNSTSLDKLVKRYSIEEFVTSAGFLPRQQVLAMQRSASALLFLDWAAPNSKGILTGKIFEYLFSGKPVISIGGHHNSASNKLIRESGIGYVVGNSIDEIVDIIDILLRGESLNYSPSVGILHQYTRKHLAETMINKIISQLYAEK